MKDTKIELAVILGAFYGLRRSEVVGLKWSAIDLVNKTITIKHTVTSGSLNGKLIEIEKDRTKNKSSRRTLPLVDEFYGLLLHLKQQQEVDRQLCKGSYCTDYLDYIYLDAMGYRIKPNYNTQHFALVLKKNTLRHIRFHDLRHPYVKPTLKIFERILKCRQREMFSYFDGIFHRQNFNYSFTTFAKSSTFHAIST